MSDTTKRTTLPERDELLSRLYAVVDDAYVNEHLHVVLHEGLCEYAGKSMPGHSVLIILMKAISDQVMVMPVQLRHLADKLLHGNFEAYLRAVIVDDEVLEAAFDRMDRTSLARWRLRVA